MRPRLPKKVHRHLCLALSLALVVLSFCEPSVAQQASPSPGPSPSPSPASSPADTFRPEGAKILTNDPFPIPAGTWEVEPGIFLSRSTSEFEATGPDVPSPLVENALLNVLLTYGVRDDLDVNLSVSALRHFDRGDNGFDDDVGPPARTGAIGDVTVGARWMFHQNRARDFTAAHLVFVTLPTLSRPRQQQEALGLGTALLTYRLVGSKSWGRWSMNLDLGYTQALGHGPSGLQRALTTNLGVGWQGLDWLQPVVELNYATSRFASAPSSEFLAVTGGVLFIPNPVWRMTAGVQKAISGRFTANSSNLILYFTIVP